MNNEGFMDAQAQHEASPDTFAVIHMDDLRVMVTPGTFVKVCHSHERFWVHVDAVVNSLVTGRVANDLIVAPFKHGEVINFALSAVYDVDTSDETVDTEKGNIGYFHSNCHKPNTTSPEED